MARMRSPNYPAIPLPQAIEFVRKIFGSDRTNVIDKEVAAAHMGYRSLNGRTLKLLGGLSQYGLLDKVGKGKVRVSSTAVSILHGVDEREKAEALWTAATTPPLFKRIRENFDSPSDATITSFLMREGFTDAAVAPVLKSYSDTNAFLAASGVTESHRNGGDEGADSPPHDDQNEDDDDMDVGALVDRGDGAKVNIPRTPEWREGQLPLNSTKPLFDFETVRIETIIDNPDDLAKLIERLEQIKGMLPQGETEH